MMPSLQGSRVLAQRLRQHEYATVLLLIVVIKALTYAASVSVHGVPAFSWPAVEMLPALWNRWDAGWYLQIAAHGYTSEGPQMRAIAFYPLFPWLIRLAHMVVQEYPAAALVVSNLVASLGGIVFYRLARLDFEPCVARCSLVTLLLFPTGFFWHAPYTEGLFLLLSAGAFYAARQGQWCIAGLLGGAAALTRTPGLLLLPALLVEWFCQKPAERQGGRQVLWLGLIPAGWAVYLLINVQVYGSPLAFVSAQQVHWQMTLGWPWASVTNALLRTRLLSQLVGLQEAFMHGGAHLGAVALLLIASLWSLLRLRASYTVFLALVTLQVTALHHLLSTPRLMLSGFPLFFMLGQAVQSKILRLVWFAIALPLLWFLQQRFVTGQWAF
jgi:Gpi18-like mannosyltransferase